MQIFAMFKDEKIQYHKNISSPQSNRVYLILDKVMILNYIWQSIRVQNISKVFNKKKKEYLHLSKIRTYTKAVVIRVV